MKLRFPFVSALAFHYLCATKNKNTMDQLNFAAIDIGSNAVRLLIKGIVAGEQPGDLKKVFIVRVPLRLGQDSFTLGRISTVKSNKLVRLMAAFNQMMQVYNVVEYRACATSAMRDAANGAELVKEIFDTTGIRVEIINGLEEARIVYDSHIVDIMKEDGNFAYVDVGGGSTEISVISNGELIQSNSYNVGTVRILNKKVIPAELKRMYNDARMLCEKYPGIELIGSGGNVNKLYKLSGAKDGMPMTIDQLSEVRERLAARTVKQRMQEFDLKPDRADVIVPAADIYLQIASRLNNPRLWVPTIGIVDGIAYTLCAEYQKGNL